MRKSKVKLEQILQALRQAEGGTAVVDICPKMGVTQTRSTAGEGSTPDSM
jgi:hypothetical protein